jgi:hypothetical protein
MSQILDYVTKRMDGAAAEIRKIKSALQAMHGKQQLIEDLMAGSRSITEEIDSIPGRRIFYNLNGQATFVAADQGNRGAPINFLVSQDGPFVMTHYPMAVWRPNLPTNATNFGLWRPVAAAWPLADQVIDSDIVAISWEFADGGSQRNMQNLPTAAFLSRPDNLVPLSVPTLFTPNTTIQFFPTFQAILFNDAGVPPTEGTLEVMLPGYRIVNM